MSGGGSSVRLLAFSDVHLRRSGETVDVEALSVPEFDLVVSLGDVIDDNRDDAKTAESGRAYERRGRAFFEALNETGTPGIAISGNHDPLDCTRRLTEGLAHVRVAHLETVGEQDLPGGPALDGLSVFGWGCEQFDFTPALPAPEYPELSGVERGSDTLLDAAATHLERAAGRYLAGVDTREELLDRIGVSDRDTEPFDRALDRLETRFETLVEGIRATDGPQLVAAHVSPFNVPFDYRGKHKRNGGPHFGSLALKLAVLETSPLAVLSGHMHQRGLTAMETGCGYTYAHNPGDAGASTIRLDDSGQFQVEELALPMGEPH